MNRDEREQRDVSRGLPPRLDPRAGKPPRRGRETASTEPTSSAGRSGRAAARGGRIVATLLSLTLLCASGWGWHLGRVAEAAVNRTDAIPTSGNDQSVRTGEAMNLLLVGSDSRSDLTDEQRRELQTGKDAGQNTDTMILVHVPADGSKASFVSFPRDSYVQIPGYGQDKLNAAYAYGYRDAPENASEDAKLAAGAQLLVQTISSLTGLQIDHYAEVDLLGFFNLSSVVGGVEVNLCAPVNDRRYSGAQFDAGVQTISGVEALRFVRQRHGLPRGDFDRIIRQQVFIAGVLRKMLSDEVLLDLGKQRELVQAASESLTVDQSLNLMQLAEQMQSVSPGSIDFQTVPYVGDDADEDGRYILRLEDEDKLHTFFADLSAEPDEGRGRPEDRGPGDRGPVGRHRRRLQRLGHLGPRGQRRRWAGGGRIRGRQHRQRGLDRLHRHRDPARGRRRGPGQDARRVRPGREGQGRRGRGERYRPARARFGLQRRGSAGDRGAAGAHHRGRGPAQGRRHDLHQLMSRPSAALPADLLAAAVAQTGAAPLVTSYDDATGERVELSAVTLANWVAKTANLLQDEFDVAPGSTVAVALPVHWQTAAVLLAVWSCGAAVLDTAAEDDDRLSGADVVLAAADRLPALEEQGLDQLLGLSLHPLGLGMAGYAGPARDFALEVRSHGDHFTPWQPPHADAVGLVLGGRVELTLGGLVQTAAELAARLGIASGDRILVDERTAEEAGPVAWLLAPLSAGASLVLCRVGGPGRPAPPRGDRARHRHAGPAARRHPRARPPRLIAGGRRCSATGTDRSIMDGVARGTLRIYLGAAPASGRPSPCSARRTGGAPGAPTSSSGWSRRTAGGAPLSSSRGWRCCPAGRSPTAA